MRLISWALRGAPGEAALGPGEALREQPPHPTVPDGALRLRKQVVVVMSGPRTCRESGRKVAGGLRAHAWQGVAGAPSPKLFRESRGFVWRDRTSRR